MIRRGFWLVAGAAIGVAGYRKATRLARMLSGQTGVLSGQTSVPRLTPGTGASVTPWPVRLGSGARSSAAFVRDVRAGMAEYRAGQANGSALHNGQIGRSLGSRSPENPGGQAQPGVDQRGPREH
jgi:hypothetical protein